MITGLPACAISATARWKPAIMRRAPRPCPVPMFTLVLRRGEACGLRDEDVDLDHAHLTVAQQITTVQYRTTSNP